MLDVRPVLSNYRVFGVEEGVEGDVSKPGRRGGEVIARPDKRVTPQGPGVCAVVLNWNNPGDTLKCLDSLYGFMQHGDLAVVVVDNASTDDSIEQLSKWCDDRFRMRSNLQGGGAPTPGSWSFVLIQSNVNCGYAAGNNIGIKAGLELPGVEYIWILNNDTVVDAEALGHLLECGRTFPDVGIFGSTILDCENPTAVQCAAGCRYHAAFSIVQNVYGKTASSYVMGKSADVSLDYVSGAAMFCRAEMFRNVGLLDERFFLYYEELDLARRIHDVGYTLRWCKDSIVYHKGGATTGGKGWKDNESWISSYHENLSTLLYTKKHHPWLLPSVVFSRLVGKIFSAVIRRRKVVLSTLLMVFWEVLRKGSINHVNRKQVGEQKVTKVGLRGEMIHRLS